MKNIEFPYFLIGVGVHPDDDTLTTHLRQHNLLKGGRNGVICLGQGDYGRGNLPENLRSISTKELKKLRTSEFHNACDRYGISPEERIIFDYGDARLFSSLSDPLQIEIENHIENFARKFDPDLKTALVSFEEKRGYSGHENHRLTAKMVARVAKKMKIPLFRIVRPPLDVCPNFDEAYRLKQSAGHYENENCPAQEPNFYIDGDKEKKLADMSCYPSQFKGLDPRQFVENKDEAKRVLEREYYYFENQE